MNIEHVFVALIAAVISVFIGGLAAESAAHRNCITYHNQMTVVEANKTCDAILKTK